MAKKYFIHADLDYVQGHLRSGQLAGTVELTDEELEDLKKDNQLAKEFDLSIVNVSYCVDDVGDVDGLKVYEIDSNDERKEIDMTPVDNRLFSMEEDWSLPQNEVGLTADDSFKYEVKDAPEQGTDKWLEWRKQGITATEAASIMFPDKYSSPLKVYNMKIGLLENDQTDNDGFLEWGHIIEDDLVRKFAKNHPECTGITQGRLYQREWMKCSLDAQCYDSDGKPLIIECKSSQSMAKWNPYPDRYYAQVQWQMLVTGIRKAVIVVVVAENGWHYFEREIEYNPAFVKKMIEKCYTVWDCIQVKTPPATLGIFATDKDAIAAMAGETGHSGPAEEIDLATVEKFKTLKKAYEDAEEAFSAFKNSLAFKMVDKSRLTYNGRTFASWVERKGQTTIDKNLLMAKHPDVYSECLKTGVGTRYIMYKI